MTHLTVSIENPDLLRDIQKAIMMIRGVVSVKAAKTNPNPTSIDAIEEDRSCKSIHCVPSEA